MSKGINTREMIISKSAKLFNERGYYNCSLSDIMEATNLKKGGIYNHFKNKDEIALEAFDYSILEMKKRFRARLDHDQNAREKLISVIEVYADLINLPGMQSGCPIFNTAVQSANSHPLLKQKAIKALFVMQKYIQIKIKEGIEKGEFRSDADHLGFDNLIIMTMEGALVMDRIGNKNSIEIAVKTLKSFLREKIVR